MRCTARWPSGTRAKAVGVDSLGYLSLEGTRDMKAVLGGKGPNLAQMANLGVPVPSPACDACIAYLLDAIVFHTSRNSTSLEYRAPLPLATVPRSTRVRKFDDAGMRVSLLDQHGHLDYD